jgi:hypothetical protein
VPHRHPPNRFARTQYRAGDIRRQDLHDCLRCHCINTVQAARHARVIHQPSDLPEFAHRRLEHSKYFLLTADVRLDRNRSPAPRHNLPNHLLRAGRVRQKINSDRETVGANQPRDGRSDSAARASHNHGSTVLLASGFLNRSIGHYWHSSRRARHSRIVLVQRPA